MNLTQLAAILTMTAGTAAAEVPTRRLMISLADRKVVLIENGFVSKIYDIAVGASRTPSPHGNFALANRVVDPTWYGPKAVVEPGPANPLGTRWMGLGYRGYGIHGTNNPNSIGKAASHGCFRMRNEDAEELFELVKVGDPVEIVEESRPELTTPVYAFAGPVRVMGAGE